MLTEKDLLSFDNHRRLFSTTAKGLKFLELYNEMQQLLNKRRYLQNELKSLGIEPKINNKNDINELNDYEELQNLADVLSMYQDYKTVYSEQSSRAQAWLLSKITGAWHPILR